MLVNISHQKYLEGRQQSAISSRFALEHSFPKIDTVTGRTTPRQHREKADALKNSLSNDYLLLANNDIIKVDDNGNCIDYKCDNTDLKLNTNNGNNATLKKDIKLLKKIRMLNSVNKDSDKCEWTEFNKGIDLRLNNIMRNVNTAKSIETTEKEKIIPTNKAVKRGNMVSFSFLKTGKNPNQQELNKIINENDIKLWQDFSIKISKEMKSESSVSLPILGFTSGFIDQKKKSKNPKSKLLIVKNSPLSDLEKIQGPSSFAEILRKNELDRKIKKI